MPKYYIAATKNDQREGSEATWEMASKVLYDYIHTNYARRQVRTENEPRKMTIIDSFSSEIVGNRFLFRIFCYKIIWAVNTRSRMSLDMAK